MNYQTYCKYRAMIALFKYDFLNITEMEEDSNGI